MFSLESCLDEDMLADVENFFLLIDSDLDLGILMFPSN